MYQTIDAIRGASQHSVPNVNVSISGAGALIGSGVAKSDVAIQKFGSNLDNILKSFGGDIDGGDISIGGKAKKALKKMSKYGGDLESELDSLKSRYETVIREVEGRIDESEDMKQLHAMLKEAFDNDLSSFKDKLQNIKDKNDQYVEFIDKISGSDPKAVGASAISLAFTQMNALGGLAEEISSASGAIESAEGFIGGSVKTGGLAMNKNGLLDRLEKSNKELRQIINEFIDKFGDDVLEVRDGLKDLRNQIASNKLKYDEKVINFVDTFKRFEEFVNDDKDRTLFQTLLELNPDKIDQKEVKDRFLSLFRNAASDAPFATKFVAAADKLVRNVNSYSDKIKSFRDTMRASGGATDMDRINELFSTDASRVNISGMTSALNELKVAVKQLDFIKQIGMFRDNLMNSVKEISSDSKDYSKNVGKTIASAIKRIQDEYNDIIKQIEDTKTGLGLEIDMYNSSAATNKKISKERLKQMYKWQSDSRIGLYKAIEAIDAYLLHFTENAGKNPEILTDLQKLLSSTRIIAKWYDVKSGDRLMQLFESLNPIPAAGTPAVDTDAYRAAWLASTHYADLQTKVGAEAAIKLYERCRAAIEGVSVLKNIISYFVSVGEKLGDIKSDKDLFMSPNAIYKCLVNYIYVSAIAMNTTGTEILDSDNQLRRTITYKDTEVGLAQVSDFDPEKYGIGFGNQSVEKLRILKFQQEAHNFKQTTSVMDAQGLARAKQLVVNGFALLGKSQFIKSLLLLGVYNLESCTTELEVRGILEGMLSYFANTNTFVQVSFVPAAVGGAAPGPAVRFVLAQPPAAFPAARYATAAYILGAARPANVDCISPEVLGPKILEMPAADRNTRIIFDVCDGDYTTAVDGSVLMGAFARNIHLLTLKELQSAPVVGVPAGAAAAVYGIDDLIGIKLLANNLAPVADADYRGALYAFAQGFFNNNTGHPRLAERFGAITGIVANSMMSDYRSMYVDSVFRVDDTYFVLAIKAMAGKVMTVTGVNRMLHTMTSPAYPTNPDSLNAHINETRLIMGGAKEGEIIDDAIELYVRLPLLVEFYRIIFDNGNMDNKRDTTTGASDEERVSYVPEVGSVWSGLIKIVFDKSKLIENGLYTKEEIRSIIHEINKIYEHFKSKASKDDLIRHIMQELVSEVNSRYGVIKRQDLTQYYRLVNAAKKNTFDVSETNYTSNDFDILGDDYVGKSPSDEFLNLKKDLDDPKIDSETKLARLTDYKIVKEFRDRITGIYTNPAVIGAAGAQGPTPLVDRIRLLKKTISLKTDMNEKYDMILKAIDEANDTSQVPKDVMVAFHEMVIAPTRAAYALYESTRLVVDTLAACVSLARNGAIVGGAVPPGVLSTPVRVNDVDSTWDAVLTANLASIVANATAPFGGVQKFRLCNHVCETNVALTQLSGIGGGALAPGDAAYVQAVIMEALTRMTSMNKFIKVDVSSTGRITVDMSEMQKALEHLIAQTKFMIDKFTGVIPTAFIKSMMNASQQGTIYWLEQNALVGFFNKTERRGYATNDAAYNIDLFNKMLPIITDIMKRNSNSDLIVHLTDLSEMTPRNYLRIPYESAIPMVKAAFKAYDVGRKQYVSMVRNNYLVAGVGNRSDVIDFSGMVCDLQNTSVIGDGQHGVIQKFNSLLKNYLNDLYDSQSNKIYTKAFANFAGSSAVSALDGSAIPDFLYAPQVVARPSFVNQYQIPMEQTVISGTLAYVMRVMMTRVNPITGMKIHELSSFSDIGPYMMDRYRAFIPMYKRLFTTFLEQCKLQRKLIQYLSITGNTAVVPIQNINNAVANTVGYYPTNGEVSTDVENFIQNFVSIPAGTTPDVVRTTIIGHYDEVINCVTALIQDVNTVHKELLETDDATPMFFDTRKDFTKNFMNNNKALPFAPASTLALALAPGANADTIKPFYMRTNIYNSKFAYGIRSLISGDFKISISNAPFMKEVLNTFNGVTSMRNKVEEKKLNDMLALYGDVINVLLDARWYGGVALNRTDFLLTPLIMGAPAAGPPVVPATAPLFQMIPANFKKAISIAETTSLVDGKNAIYEFIKTHVVIPPGAAAPVPANPRVPAIMGNLVDHMIMPINVHALMRDVPLNQLYMYSLTFDSIVTNILAGRVSANVPIAFIQEYLKNPYKPINVNGVAAGAAAAQLTNIQYDNNAATQIDPNAIFTDANGVYPRFFKDILLGFLIKNNAAHNNAMAASVQTMMNTKIYHNMMFLVLVQWAIQQKIKIETEFINTRVVDRNVVSDTITLDHTSTNDVVNDQLFEF